MDQGKQFTALVQGTAVLLVKDIALLSLFFGSKRKVPVPILQLVCLTRVRPSFIIFEDQLFCGVI